MESSGLRGGLILWIAGASAIACGSSDASGDGTFGPAPAASSTGAPASSGSDDGNGGDCAATPPRSPIRSIWQYV